MNPAQAYDSSCLINNIWWLYSYHFFDKLVFVINWLQITLYSLKHFMLLKNIWKYNQLTSLRQTISSAYSKRFTWCVTRITILFFSKPLMHLKHPIFISKFNELVLILTFKKFTSTVKSKNWQIASSQEYSWFIDFLRIF